MRKLKKRKGNLAAAKLADALQEIADSEREKIFDRLQKVLDSARKKVLSGLSKGRTKSTAPKKLRKKKAKA